MTDTATAPRAALPSGVVGLRTWIWHNNARSLALFAAFPVLVAAVFWLIVFAWAVIDGWDARPGHDLYGVANRAYASLLPFVLIGVAVWFAIAWIIHSEAVLNLAQAKLVSKAEEPRLFRLVEPLVISRGLPIPQMAVIPSPGLNAFATGWSSKDAVIGVTRGLLDTLDDDELEAVLAHELTHIINRDTRVLVTATVFVGIFALASELAMRFLRGSSRGSGNSKDRGKTMLFLLAVWLILLVGRVGAMALRFAISRKREFMADAGAVELTKNGDALVRALSKIRKKPEVAEVSDEVQQMFIFDPPDVWEIFSTHPEIEDRIAAIRAIG